MKSLLLALFAVTAMAQVPIPGPSSGTGASVSLPPFPAVSNAGTDVICALHADVITGVTCNNAVVDGTTEIAFATVATIPARALANAVTTVNFLFGGIGTATVPTFLVRVRYGTISGPIVFQSAATAPTAGSRGASLNCIFQVNGSSTTAPSIFGCANANLFNTSINSNALITNTAVSVPIDPTIASSLTVTVQFGAATTQNALWLYSISSTPTGSTASGGLFTAQRTLSAAEINTMFTSPVLFIPAQGSGTLISFNKCIYNPVFGSAAFTGGGNIALFYGNTSPPVSLAVNTLTAVLLTTFSANQFAAPNTALPPSILSAAGVNGAVYISNQTGVFAGGTGSSMTITCQYSVLTGIQ